MKPIFRSEAMKNLHTQDDGNSLLSLVKGSSWSIIIPIVVILLSIIYWTVYVEIKDRLKANGILLVNYSGIDSPCSGIVTKINVKKNTYLKKQTLIAVIIKDVEIIAQLKKKLRKLDRYKYMREEMEQNLSDSQKQKRSKLYEIIDKTETSITDFIEIEHLTLENKIQVKEHFERKEVSLDLLNQVANSYRDAVTKRKKMEKTIETNKIDIELADLEVKKEEKNYEILLTELALEIEALRKLAYQKIVSHLEGKIIELNVVDGLWVKKGDRLLTLESVNTSNLAQDESNNKMKLLCYMPHMSGKSVKKDDKVYISPSNVKVEEYGYMRGYVKKVYDMPISDENMKIDLPNIDTVKYFKKQMKDRALTKIIVEIERSKDNNIQWTSSQGPDFEINTGTICSAYIEVAIVYPYEKAVNWLSKFYQIP